MAAPTYQNIVYIKNVTHKGHEVGEHAYLNLIGSEFILHFPDRFRNRILDASIDDLIIVYQKMGKERYLTHLVHPIDNEIRDYYVAENFRFGRLVRTIAYTGTGNAIPMAAVPPIDLVNSFGYTIPIVERVPPGTLEQVQKCVWEMFRPFLNHQLLDNSSVRNLFDNDELERDYESAEGKLLFRQHRTRERDSRLTAEKKKQSLEMGAFRCSVCNFSFLDVYGEYYVECHHMVPISQGERITRLEDLALVCSNCHRMLHRKIKDDYLSVDQLRELIGSRPS